MPMTSTKTTMIFFFKSIKCCTFSEPQACPDLNDDDDNNSNNVDIDNDINEDNKEEDEDEDEK